MDVFVALIVMNCIVCYARPNLRLGRLQGHSNARASSTHFRSHIVILNHKVHVHDIHRFHGCIFAFVTVCAPYPFEKSRTFQPWCEPNRRPEQCSLWCQE
jgi:hypothetical protein